MVVALFSPFDGDKENSSASILSSLFKSRTSRAESLICNPMEQWRWDGGKGCASPIVGHITDDNGDGIASCGDVPDVLFHRVGRGGIVAVSGDDGRKIRIFGSTMTKGDIQSALADIDSDGEIEILGINVGAKKIIAYENDGTEKWRSDTVPASTMPEHIGIADFNQESFVGVSFKKENKLCQRSENIGRCLEGQGKLCFIFCPDLCDFSKYCRAAS